MSINTFLLVLLVIAAYTNLFLTIRNRSKTHAGLTLLISLDKLGRFVLIHWPEKDIEI